jgi:hypothetical protein
VGGATAPDGPRRVFGRDLRPLKEAQLW